MKILLSSLEVEKQKLNQLGNESLANGIPLFKNNALQAQSRKVDELIVQLHKQSGLKRRSS
ncbi:hypothetical protein [Paenibacillus ihumii]|uniref:hypothetical protein n=1 Tax=Paenibacillus ihumii TaxID=687436 RepID=UPI0006D81F8B|nr:hypothetical protein [Paenibacillus ihumii]